MDITECLNRAFTAHAETYEGWTNRETWAVSLWINNEEDMYRRSQTLINENKYSAVDLATALQEWFDDELLNTEIMDVEFVLKLRDEIGSFWRVEWIEIARSFLADVPDRNLWEVYTTHRTVALYTEEELAEQEAVDGGFMYRKLTPEHADYEIAVCTVGITA